MVEVKQDCLNLKVKPKPDTLTPLAFQQTARVVEGFASQGATFFSWEKFHELTKDLPPNTRIADILESLKKTK